MSARRTTCSTTLITMPTRGLFAYRSILLAPVLLALSANAFSQSAPEEPAPPSASTANLPLSVPRIAELEHALNAHDYVTAEKILLAEIDRASQPSARSHLLELAGTVYFLNHDDLNAAIAWKKAETIAPLDSHLKFSLAMAYVRIHHPEWARAVLDSLRRTYPEDALYPFWLGRLNYDGHDYDGAIRSFLHATELDPHMARAWDNLGLCYYYQNRNTEAVASYNRAIELERSLPHPSPWPFLNLAVTQQFLNQLPDAEANLRRALELDSRLAPAHFQLGTVLEDEGRNQDAVIELLAAISIDQTYAEPHMALARVYRKLGRDEEARREVKMYLQLHPHSTPSPR